MNGLDRQDLHRKAEDLLAAGQMSEAVTLLVEANLEQPEGQTEELLVRIRRDLGRQVTERSRAGSGRRAEEVPDLFDAPGIPEVSRAELNAEVLHSALSHRGSLLVRGFLSEATAVRLRAQVERAFEAARAWRDGAEPSETSPWYVPFEPIDPSEFGAVERRFSQELGGVLSVESPRVFFEVIEALRAAGSGDLLEEYFGEWPVISAKKSTLRHATSSSPTEWHQDGAFLGQDTPAVNIWTSLTRCGRDAPGIDMVPAALDRIVETGTGSALFDWSVASEQAEQVASGGTVRPTMEPGDAVLFNQMSLHRAGVDPAMTDERYAIESWFFVPSKYPYDQVPIFF